MSAPSGVKSLDSAWSRVIGILQEGAPGERDFQSDLSVALSALMDVCRAQVAEWRDVAAAEQEALRRLVLERDGLSETLLSTTQDMNRYFEYWKAASGTDGSRPCPSVDVLVQIHRAAYDNALPFNRCLKPWGLLGPQDQAAHDTAMQAVLAALAPHLSGCGVELTADGAAAHGSGDLAAARKKALDLMDRLAAEQRAAALALKNQATRYEARLLDLRGNHENEMTGIRALLRAAEYRAECQAEKLAAEKKKLTTEGTEFHGSEEQGVEIGGAA